MRESVVPGLSVRGFPPTVKGILSDAVNGAHSVYRMWHRQCLPCGEPPAREPKDDNTALLATRYRGNALLWESAVSHQMLPEAVWMKRPKRGSLFSSWQRPIAGWESLTSRPSFSLHSSMQIAAISISSLEAPSSRRQIQWPVGIRAAVVHSCHSLSQRSRNRAE